jgi:hypothetical protein
METYRMKDLREWMRVISIISSKEFLRLATWQKRVTRSIGKDNKGQQCSGQLFEDCGVFFCFLFNFVLLHV